MTKPIQTPSEDGTKVIMQKNVGIWGYMLAGKRSVMMNSWVHSIKSINSQAEWCS